MLGAESTTGPECGRENHNDLIGNRTYDLQPCSIVHRPTAAPRIPPYGFGFGKMVGLQKFHIYIYISGHNFKFLLYVSFP